MEIVSVTKEMGKKLGEFMKKADKNLKNIEKDIEMKLAEKANTAQVVEQMKDLETRINYRIVLPIKKWMRLWCPMLKSQKQP